MDLSPPEIPSHFLCPISLQMMRDPVTLPTGITYDRDSIEHWLFVHHRSTCPLTNQPLPHPHPDVLTPNHTLRRLIQSWCSLHSSLGIPRLPSPRPPLHHSQISLLLLPSPNPLPSLTKLHQLISQSDRNKRFVQSTPAALQFLASVVATDDPPATDHAVTILHALQLPQPRLRELIDQGFVLSLTRTLHRSPHAVLLLRALVAEMSPAELISLGDDFFGGIVGVLRDRVCYRGMKAGLRALHAVTPWGRNRWKAVKAGAVKVIVELLVDEDEKKACEMMMVVLEELCGGVEGRAELVAHAAGIAVVGKKMGRVSAVATERAVRIVYLIAMKEARKEVVEEMLHVGVVSKLVLLVGGQCEESVRRMVKEVLRMHFSVWRRSPCLTPRLKALYPS